MSDSDDGPKPIILDNGTGFIKAGFAEDPGPRTNFPTVVGRRMGEDQVNFLGQKEFFIGQDAVDNAGVLALDWTIDSGHVKNWEDMEQIWSHTFFEQLRVNPDEHCVMVTEAPLNSNANREKSIELLHETFDVAGSSLQVQGALAMWASGHTSGMVVDIGDGVTHCMPVVDGMIIKSAIKKLGLAGRTLTEQMAIAMSAHTDENLWESQAGMLIAQGIKDATAYVALDYDAEMERPEAEVEEQYTMPGGDILTVGRERFRVGEVLFNPRKIISKDWDGVSDMINKSIDSLENDLHRTMWSNIVLSGGSTLLAGLPDRIEADVRSHAPADVEINVMAAQERALFVFIGGSILASLPTFESQWISSEEYDEEGPQVVHRKCPSYV